MTQVIGQKRAIQFLNGLVKKDRVPHALLLFGAEGSGAVATALAFARGLHCEAEGPLPCEECRECRKTSMLNHPDFSILFPFSSRLKEDAVRVALQQVVQNPYSYALPEDNTTISVGQIRELQRQFVYGSYQGAWRTAVIMHADRMRPESANALLKTLEEPPPRSLMVLTTSHLEALLPTIVSRCQFLKFPPLLQEDVKDGLVAYGVGDTEAEAIGRSCGGCFRQALQMANGNVAEFQDRAFRFLDALVWGQEACTYAAIEQLASERQNVLDVLKGAEAWLRDVLWFHTGKREQLLHNARVQDVERLASAFDVWQIDETIQKIELLREMNFRNVNLQLGLVSLWRQVSARASAI